MKKSTWDLMCSRPALSEAEKRLEFAELYDRERCGPDACVLYALREDNQMKPEDVIFDLKALLTTGPLQVENGYCNLPNGGGYAAVRTKFRGVTVDEYNWWRKWRFDCSAEDEALRYKLWCPGSHLAQRHTPSETAVEDIGAGPEEFRFIERLTKEDLFAPEILKQAKAFTFYLSRAQVFSPHYPPEGQAGIVLHVVRPTAYGFEMRSRFWQGYSVEDGKLICILKQGERVYPDFPYLIAHHCANEMSNLCELLQNISPKMACSETLRL